VSVFTPVSTSELSTFLEQYDVGSLLQHEGIIEGIENTNFFVDTDQARFVLTLFEYLPIEELPWFMELMFGLSAGGMAGAAPIKTKAGEFLTVLNGKPAALIQRLPGRAQMSPNATHCAEIGRAMGQMHSIGTSLALAHRNNIRDQTWAEEIAIEVLPRMDTEQAELLATEITFQAENPRNQLPQGIVHADLFRDNALYDGEKLSGVIDFYFACHDALAYDLAILVNDWCVDNQGHIDPSRYDALMAAYQSQRQLTDAEWEAWPQMLRAGALRFWLSRLKDKLFPREGEMTYIKDPNVFFHMLSRHIDSPCKRS
jgi:homoserine kinase type II